MSTGLPTELIQAIEQEAQGAALPELRRAVVGLSERYRAHKTSAPQIASNLEAVAYAAYRMPATYAALEAVIAQVRRRVPGWSPASLLDIGAGSGAGLWATATLWPTLADSTLIDLNAPMIALGQRLASHSSSTAITSAHWLRARFGPELEILTADLVVASYVANELPPSELRPAVDHLWNAAKGMLIVVEPGTPAGFEVLREVRRRLIELGGQIIAPCPHGSTCPMADGDWCHFSVRLTRSRVHQSVKPGELGYEDEKFSYVAVSRDLGEPGPSRILRRPASRRRMIELRLCTPDGLQEVKLTRRKAPEQYRLARSSSWGDEFPLG